MAQIPERAPNMEGPLEADPDVSPARPLNFTASRAVLNYDSSFTMARIQVLVMKCMSSVYHAGAEDQLTS